MGMYAVNQMNGNMVLNYSMKVNEPLELFTNGIRKWQRKTSYLGTIIHILFHSTLQLGNRSRLRTDKENLSRIFSKIRVEKRSPEVVAEMSPELKLLRIYHQILSIKEVLLEMTHFKSSLFQYRYKNIINYIYTDLVKLYERDPEIMRLKEEIDQAVLVKFYLYG